MQGGPKGKAKAAPKKAAKPDLTEEELKTLKEENAKVNKTLQEGADHVGAGAQAVQQAFEGTGSAQEFP